MPVPTGKLLAIDPHLGSIWLLSESGPTKQVWIDVASYPGFFSKPENEARVDVHTHVNCKVTM